MICKDCKYWSVDYLGSCDKISWGCNLTQEQAYLLVRADDDQGLECMLMTKPDFGCNLFAQKET